MFGKFKLWSAIALIAVLSLLSVPAAMAGAPTGAGPDSAMAPAAGPVTLAPGQWHWYAFDSSAAPADANDMQIMIDLAANPQGSVAFSVWTPDAARGMLAGDTTAAPIGNGTVNVVTDGSTTGEDRFNGDLVWVSSSKDAANYYLVVQSLSTTPSTYTLRITGNYISFPTAAPASQPAASTGSETLPAPMVLPAAGQASQTTQAAPQGANGPFNAYPVTGQTRRLAVGGQDWYSFVYPSYDAAGNHTVVSLQLNAAPQGSATFSIWDANGVNGWVSQDPNAKPVGNGTLHPVNSGDDTYDRFGGNLEWSGALVAGGTYYIQVQQAGPASGTYSLQMAQQ